MISTISHSDHYSPHGSVARSPSSQRAPADIPDSSLRTTSALATPISTQTKQNSSLPSSSSGSVLQHLAQPQQPLSCSPSLNADTLDPGVVASSNTRDPLISDNQPSSSKTVQSDPETVLATHMQHMDGQTTMTQIAKTKTKTETPALVSAPLRRNSSSIGTDDSSDTLQTFEANRLQHLDTTSLDSDRYMQPIMASENHGEISGDEMRERPSPRTFLVDNLQHTNSDQRSRRPARPDVPHAEDEDDAEGKDEANTSSCVSDSQDDIMSRHTQADTHSSFHEANKPQLLSELEILESGSTNTNSSFCTFRPTSSIPSLSLLYADTAPTNSDGAWRVELEAYLKKHLPAVLKDVEKADPLKPVIERGLKSHWSHKAIQAQHDAKMWTIRRANPRRELRDEHMVSSAVEDETDIEDEGSMSDVIEDHTSSVNRSKRHQQVRKQPSNPLLRSPRKKTYAQRDVKPYSRTSPSASLVNIMDSNMSSRPRTNSHSRLLQPVMTISPAEQNVQPVAVPGIARVAIPPSAHSGYRPLSPPSSPSQLPVTLTTTTTASQPVTVNSTKRRCISCNSDQSPCWRPSWSAAAGQLCNSCGLRYKKTNARCIEAGCGRIPAKGEWVTMKNAAAAAVAAGKKLSYKCLYCNGRVEMGEKH